MTVRSREPGGGTGHAPEVCRCPSHSVAALGFQPWIIEGLEAQLFSAVLAAARIAGSSPQIGLGGITKFLEFGEQKRFLRDSLILSLHEKCAAAASLDGR